MNPDITILLQGASRAVAEAQQIGVGDAAVKLNTTDALLRLLHHGTDAPFHVRHYAKGRELMTSGLKALSRRAGKESAELATAAGALTSALNPDWNADLFEKHHDALQTVLTRITASILSSGILSKEEEDFLRSGAAWENEFYAHFARAVPERASAGTGMKLDREAIQACLKRRLPDQGDIEVVNARSLAGGYGRATVLIELAAPLFGTRDLVIRAELPVSILTLEGIDITTEFHVLKLAYAAGIPAPEPLLLEAEENETGLRFILVRKARGRNVGSAFGASQALSGDLLRNLMEGLIAIHNIDLQKHVSLVAATHLQSWISDPTVSASVHRWIEMWRAYARSTQFDSPLLTRAYEWLLANVPHVSDRPSLLHSDYGFGNLLIENDQVTAVLDWEATHLGDPAEEVGWIIFNLRGQVREDELLRLYESVGGKRIEAFRLRYFDVFTVVKMATCGIAALMKYRNNEKANPIFCLLATYTIEPFMKQIEEFIDRAEAVKVPAGQKVARA